MINGGGDVDEKCFLLAVVALVSTLVGTQEIGQISGGPLLDRAVAVGWSTLRCWRQSLTLQIPDALPERAKDQARLMHIPRASLKDDASGVVNIAREKKIRKLAGKL
jgi:hypothetical protein